MNYKKLIKKSKKASDWYKNTATDPNNPFAEAIKKLNEAKIVGKQERCMYYLGDIEELYNNDFIVVDPERYNRIKEGEDLCTGILIDSLKQNLKNNKKSNENL